MHLFVFMFVQFFFVLACSCLSRDWTQPKTEMIRAGVDFAFAAGADDVARAILIVAKKRAAAMHALLLVRLGRIEWRIRALSD